MDIEYFYSLVRLVTAALTISILLYIWTRYLKIIKLSKIYSAGKDYGLIVFSLAIIPMEMQNIPLIAGNSEINVFALILSDALALVGVTYLDHFSFAKYKNRKQWFVIISATAVILYFTSIILFSLFPDNLFLGHLPSILFTSFTFLIVGKGVYGTFVERDLTGIGVIALLSVVLHFFCYVNNELSLTPQSFQSANRALQLSSYFGVLAVLLILALSWLNELRAKIYSHMYFKDNTLNNTGSEQSENKQKVVERKKIDKSELLKLIQKDKTEEVIEKLAAYSSKNYLNMDDVLLLASKLNRLNTEKLRGTIDDKDYYLFRNQVNQGVLQIIKSY